MAETKTQTLFEKLYGIDVSDKIEKKGKCSYLTWAWAWAEFVKVCPDVTYEVKKFNGLPYVYDPATGYMVYTSVTAGGITHEMHLPVMDYNNKALKQASMFEINKAIMRCLTKNLAMFGLGLYVYAGEDLPEDPTKEKEPTKKATNSKQTAAAKSAEAAAPKEVKEYKCCDCGKPFEPFESKGKTYTAGQAYEMSIKFAAQQGIKDGKARCKSCREKIIAERETGNAQ